MASQCVPTKIAHFSSLIKLVFVCLMLTFGCSLQYQLGSLAYATVTCGFINSQFSQSGNWTTLHYIELLQSTLQHSIKYIALKQ